MTSPIRVVQLSLQPSPEQTRPPSAEEGSCALSLVHIQVGRYLGERAFLCEVVLRMANKCEKLGLCELGVSFLQLQTWEKAKHGPSRFICSLSEEALIPPCFVFMYGLDTRELDLECDPFRPIHCLSPAETLPLEGLQKNRKGKGVTVSLGRGADKHLVLSD